MSFNDLILNLPMTIECVTQLFPLRWCIEINAPSHSVSITSFVYVSSTLIFTIAFPPDYFFNPSTLHKYSSSFIDVK